MRPFFRIGAAALFLAALFVLSAPAGEPVEAGALPLRPGERVPPPRQRALRDVESIPGQLLACPVCGREVSVPLADLLVRRPPGLAEDEPAPKWRMLWASRDADLAPYPPEGFLAYEADIVLCPNCGYANTVDEFPLPVPPDAARWVRASLTPELRAAERALVGRRSEVMTDEELIVFFNRQELLPDTLRTEHWRTYLAAVRAPALRRAEAAWRAAWAARREAASPPRSALLAERAAAFLESLEKIRRSRPGLPGEIDAVRERLRRLRQGKTGLPDADNMAGRVLLAGQYARLGFLNDAEAIYENLFSELRERFLRHEQDPLWPATTQGAPVGQRLNELEALRSDGEKEIFVKAELVRRERALLREAADRVRDALRAGDLDGRREDALFYAYLVGEFLRRAGDLPLAAEWFENLRNLAEPGSPLSRAAEMQLRYVGEEAGDRVNLLSALGKDAELFAKLREISR